MNKTVSSEELGLAPMASSTQIVPRDERMGTVKKMLEQMAPQLADALPKHITAERMLRVSLTTVRANPALLEADPMSLLGAVMECAGMGLEPDGIHAAITGPYRSKDGRGKFVVFMPMYRGLLSLARRSGQIKRISPRAVFKGDVFTYSFGLEEKLVHRPKKDGSRDGKAFVAVYAVAEMSDGTKIFDVMNREEIDGIRGKSRSGGSGPWVTDFAEMAKKTVLKRLCKVLPTSREDAALLQRALTMDDLAERGMEQPLTLPEDLIPAVATPPPDSEPAGEEAAEGSVAQ